MNFGTSLREIFNNIKTTLFDVQIYHLFFPLSTDATGIPEEESKLNQSLLF